MKAGDLRHRITLQTPSTARTPGGGQATEYEDWITVWAAIEPLSTREYFAASQIASDVSVKIRIRYRQGITAKHRIKHVTARGSPTRVDFYDLDGEPLETEGRRRELVLMCKLRAAEGFRTGDTRTG